jgi:intermediate peptidase
MQVALTFLRDFEKSGIHLPGPLRARFVELSDSLIAVGRTFLSYASSGPPQTPRIEIPDADRLLAGMGSRFIESLPRGSLTKRSSRYVVPGSWEAQMVTRFAREGEARQLVYMGNMRADPERVAVLDRMMSERAELAGVLGKSNWAEVALVDKMAKTPENVMGFLQSLANHHHPAAAADIAALQRLKATSLTGNPISPDVSTASLPPLYAWDRDFYAEKLALSLNASSLPPISPYFSTGTVLLGLSRLFTRLYGISFRPAPISAGEVWHPSVRRLDVVDESEGLIGVIYCDLFSRDGKPPTAAHYTVRCSRRVDDDDLRGDRLPEGWDAAYGPGLEEEGVGQRGRDGRYQLPIVVLTTDFGTAEAGRPALLSWTDVETLFHEMGHAIHCE